MNETPKYFTDEMREAFKRSKEFLDLDKTAEDPTGRQREEMKTKLDGMTQDELALVQELLHNMNDCKTGAGSECRQPTRQNS